MRSSDTGDVSKKLTELMFRTYYTYRDETRDMGDIGLCSHAFGILARVYYCEKIPTVNELTNMMHMKNPQLSKLLSIIEDHGYIERRRVEDNRRCVEIHITDSGKEYFERMMGIVRDRIEEDLEDRDIGDPTAVKRMIDRLYCALYID